MIMAGRMFLLMPTWTRASDNHFGVLKADLRTDSFAKVFSNTIGDAAEEGEKTKQLS